MRGGFKVFVSGAALVAMTLAAASTANAQEPAAAAPQEKKPPTFPLPEKCQDCEVVLLTVLIKPDKTADFEAVMAKVKEALAKSEAPERKQQAAGWTVFKAATPTPQGVAYVMRIDPIVKGADYDLMRIIAEVFPTEAQDLFLKYKEAFVGRGVSELKRVMLMQ